MIPTRQALGDRYRLGERIASGGMGAVYRAVDETLGRPVAVKVLRPELADDPAFLERFRREARAAAVVAHPGVAGVFDYGEAGGQPYIVMELVEGETLADRIAARGRLPWPEAFRIGEQVARALAAAHAHGLVHRDVKPANLLVATGGQAKVTDFGIAKAAASATLTRTGMVLGSANYVAPEQAQGDDVGPAADQYSLGCVLFEAVTGEPPYRGATAVAIATQHVSAPVPDPRQHRPDLPAPAADLIRRALAKDPAARFASAATMADALAAASASQPVDGGAHATSGSATLPLRGAESGTGAVKAASVARVPVGRGRTAGRWALGVGALVGVALLLLAWLPRSGLLDPPAGQPGRPRPASPTSVPTVGGPSPAEQATADEPGQGEGNDTGDDQGKDKGKDKERPKDQGGGDNGDEDD